MSVYAISAAIEPRFVQLLHFRKCKPGEAGPTAAFTYSSSVMTGCLFEGLAYNPITGRYNIDSLGIFNCPSGTGGLIVNSSCSMLLQTFYLGQGNAGVGLLVNSNAFVYYPTGAVLAATGATGNWKFNTGGVFTWAQAPRQMNQAAGTDTLGVGGTKVVTSPNLPADARIVASCKTPAGVGAPGIYSIPTANRAASAFTVNSTVAADTSTFDWFWYSPGGGPGGTFVA